MTTKLHFAFSLMVFLFGYSSFSQSNGWSESTLTSENERLAISKFHLKNDEVSIFDLNANAFRQGLVSAPLRGQGISSNTVIDVPGDNGNLESFLIYEAPVFSPSLSLKFPQIKSYVGFGVTNQGAKLRMSVSPQGVQTMITYMDKEANFLMPVSHGSSKYVLYKKSSKNDFVDEFVCSTIDEMVEANKLTQQNNQFDANDQTLRSYRLAMSVTGEYTVYHGGTVEGALAAINASITRVNEVYETDMAITFLVVDAPELIYTNPFNDPYSPASGMGSWNGQLQNTLTNTIGEAAYDIGHLFGATGGGGNAGCIGCVCEDGSKGSGITSPADGIPEGDNFDIDYVAHELGHQMGANHTFAFSTEGTGVNSEPGSGSTIMAYAGIVSGQNLQMHSDAYFHYHSINQIMNNIATAPNNCAVTTTITNNPPLANAGNDYHIPRGTAYVLKGEGTDPDGGDVLSFCWEQTDSGQVIASNFGPSLFAGTTTRSLMPTDSPDRYIPKFSRVLDGELTETFPGLNGDWETVVNVARDLNWALTVRDRDASAVGLNGQSSFDLMTITVEDVAPFTVGTPPTWEPNSTQTVTWNVGSTTNASINCQTVNILLSLDGGATFTEVASNVANDGSEEISVPDVIVDNDARLLVEAADNIFYAVSESFSISNEPDFGISLVNSPALGCSEDEVTLDLYYQVTNGFNETTTLSASGNPAGTTLTISPETLTTDGAFTVGLTGLSSLDSGTYTITITGTSASLTKEIEIDLILTNGVCTSVANMDWDTSVTNLTFNTIDNSSGKPSGYSDYTDIGTEVNRDEAYDLSVRVNTDGNYALGTMVWIDWNQNCVFEASEEYNMGVAQNVSDGETSESPLSVIVPSDAVLGTTTLRVVTQYAQFPLACDSDHDAEVEDYSVTVLPSLSVGEFDLNSFSVFPNPNNGSFTVQFNGVMGDINIDVYDIRGRKVYNDLVNGNNSDFSTTIDLGSVQSGMYLLNISTGNQNVTKKIIVN
ncbi:zinc-dependent metalloprotease [Mangrovimonas sp. ST2L15]|uniref:zinc-dependent metalloprotease n=1 Tax=Mangrovimonas sp. ST2L15 TaxID=1645916 RepID=UPI0006B6893A|nr:zinc-dependent metalloprotease [Mangrovimonas sp. ST2L15]